MFQVATSIVLAAISTLIVLIVSVDLPYKIPFLNLYGVKVSFVTTSNIVVTTAFHSDVTYRRVYLAKARKALHNSLENNP